MRTVWLTGFGAPDDVLERRISPDPVAGDGQVVIAVAAISVTFVETQVRSGAMASRTGGLELPYILGNGVSGTVMQVGAGVAQAWLGRRVVAGTGGSGGYAEQVAVPEANLVAVPEGVDLRAAAALLADGRTAVGLAEFAAPRPGERVLVEAAAGGVGSLLVQLCRAAGAEVVAAVGEASKQRIVSDLGATETVVYSGGNWTDPMAAVDIVFDGVGGEVGAAALRLLRPGGRFVQYGLASGRPTQVDRDDVTVIGWAMLGALGARATELTTTALALAAAGRLRPVIGQTFALSEAAAAHAAIAARTTVGKTLLIP